MRVIDETILNQEKGCAAGLSRLFSAQVFKEFSNCRFSPLARRILEENNVIQSLDPQMRLSEFYDWLYKRLLRCYRNEYVYKNVIASKILLGRHSLNTSFMLSEFRVANCKADTVVLNGTSNAYEIKTDYDSIDRLERQLQAYRRVFDRVHVVTSEKQLGKVMASVDGDVGVIVLTDRNTLRTVQDTSSLRSGVEPSTIYDSLRRYEYVEILKNRFGKVPDVPNTRMYETCRMLFCKLSPEYAHDEMVKVLKKRGSLRSMSDFVTSVPCSLKAMSLSCKLSRSEQATLLDTLDFSIGSCL